MHAPLDTDVEVQVWDVAVRVVHWALVALLAFQLVTGNVGDRWMAWHLVGGYAVFTLVIFRVLWGVGGSTPARFASFVRGPAATLAFARRLFSREAVPHPGHNPLGGWMVVAIIASLVVQAASGLFANDGLETTGPLALRVSLEVSDWFSKVHRANANVLVALAALHVVAVGYHWLVKKENLVRPMLTGSKRLPAALALQGLDRALPRPWRAVGFAVAALVVVVAIVRAAP